MNTILFVCTGNYYRSRFAEIYFNHKAGLLNLNWQATSRGLNTTNPNNKGPISHYSRAYLNDLGIPISNNLPFPTPLQEDILLSANLTIIMDRSEHFPMMEIQFPSFLNKVTYWSYPDIYLVGPEIILPAIQNKVDQLIKTFMQK